MADTKPVKARIKFRIPAGKATPAPPVGSMLGQHGVNMMEFINPFNEQTRPLGDVIVPVKVTIYEDRTFSFVVKTPSTAGRLGPGRWAAWTVMGLGLVRPLAAPAHPPADPGA